MKRLINKLNPIEVDVFVDIDTFPYDIVATEYKGVQIPEGELPSGIKGVEISSQVKEDYLTFIESVKELLTDYYNLELYYSNSNEDLSNYLGLLAKDSAGVPILKFNFKLRISNHPAHRSDASQAHKKEADAKLAKITKGKKLKPLVKSILVNRELFDSYEDAIIKIDEIVEHVVEIMNR